MKNEQQGRVTQVRSYLQGIGHVISQVQAYEVVARAQGFKNKHVMKAVSARPPVSAVTGPVNVNYWPVGDDRVLVRALTDEPFTAEQITSMGGKVDVILGVPLDLRDVDEFNDHLSMRLTGDEAALEDIRHEHIPEFCYGKGFVAYRVTGQVSQHFLESSEQNSTSSVPLPKFEAYCVELVNEFGTSGFYDEFDSLEKATKVARGLLNADERLCQADVLGVRPSGQAVRVASFKQ